MSAHVPASRWRLGAAGLVSLLLWVGCEGVITAGDPWSPGGGSNPFPPGSGGTFPPGGGNGVCDRTFDPGTPSQGIVPGPMFRVAGQHTFSAVGGGAVTWTMSRIEKPETGGSETRTNNVESATGAQATFNLTKTPSQETSYVVQAQISGTSYEQRIQVFPANQRSSFRFSTPGNPDVLIYVIAPATLSSASHVMIVMHGTGRIAKDYCDTWLAWGPRADTVILCPQFDNSNWSGSAGYNLGNVFTGSDGAGSKNPESRWSFTVVELLHASARERFWLNDELFSIWGHSAGGQFVHRFMIFKPNAPLRFGLPANPGWYTAPDLTIDFPYGLRHAQLSFTQADLQNYVKRYMVIMRGTLDNDPDASSLRRNAVVDNLQGTNRYDRAGYMYQKGVEVDPKSNWQLIDVPNVGHDQVGMAPAAQNFLDNPTPPLPYCW